MDTFTFKVGDKIKFKGVCESAKNGEEYIIQIDNWCNDLSQRGTLGVGWDKNKLCHCTYMWTLVESTKKKGFMSKLSIMMKKLLDADTQTLVKAGYINGDLELTEQGEQALFATLFDANKAALVTLAQADLAEAAKENK